MTKLETIGFSGNFLKILHSMYGSIESCVKICPNTVTAPFPFNKGIRQGDGLSPVLFSLYMNDIPNLLTDKKCLGIKLEDRNINCLMYADDLILISTSVNDLQHSLDVPEEHANNWKLKINVKKSSIVIFNKSGRMVKDTHFYCQGETLEITESQTYLGVAFTPSGKFWLVRETLSKKGQKVLGYIKC